MPAAKKTEGMSGLRKAAILMVSLDTDTAAKIMANLNTDEIEQLSMAIAKLEEEVTPETRDSVLREFYQIQLASKYVETGGIEYARTLLQKSLSPEEANAILESLEQTIQETPFHFLKQADTEDLLTFISDEHPQTIALILAHLPPKQAADILAGLTP
ncbi:MAG: flagellar motor switch protein FliG, partial [Planctomycetota bacterium]|nr:flagellar motor switch protein FliG [Planctomycetota bacterium]